MVLGPEEPLVKQSSKKGRDKLTRRLLIGVLIVWLITLTGVVVFAWLAYFGEKEKSQTLAQQISMACEEGSFGPEFSKEDEEALCDNAEAVIDENDPELQDEEIQESEIQEPEIQEPETQNPEDQNPEDQERESQEPETQEGEEQEGEVQDDEQQDPEIQDPEEQEPEIQDPEVDDPDPASPFEFTFNFTFMGTNYTVTCNSGTGNCVTN